MAALLDLVLLAAVVGIHTLLAAVLTRFFRIRLSTRWGTALYAATVIPLVLLVTTLFFTGVLGIGGGLDLGSSAVVLVALIALPAALGATVDVLYVTPPEEYDLPEPAEN